MSDKTKGYLAVLGALISLIALFIPAYGVVFVGGVLWTSACFPLLAVFASVMGICLADARFYLTDNE